MAISNAFKGAYTNQVSAQTQGVNNITQGVKDLGTAIVGALGFTGALGSGAIAKGAKHALAGRIGGIGGNIMLATMEEKKASAIKNQETKSLFTAEEIGKTISSELGDNPINRSAIKQLGTVFETLQKTKSEGIINKAGQIESSIGDIDPSSVLGKKILSNLKEEE